MDAASLLIPGTGFAGNHLETDDGRHLLWAQGLRNLAIWAQGPRNLESGEWFDVTGAPLDPESYGNGIGKDVIAAIDEPEFVNIHDENLLRAQKTDDDPMVIGYVHNGEAKAYPTHILYDHELVNDTVGGKPVTVGW